MDIKKFNINVLELTNEFIKILSKNHSIEIYPNDFKITMKEMIFNICLNGLIFKYKGELLFNNNFLLNVPDDILFKNKYNSIKFNKSLTISSYSKNSNINIFADGNNADINLKSNGKVNINSHDNINFNTNNILYFNVGKNSIRFTNNNSVFDGDLIINGDITCTKKFTKNINSENIFDNSIIKINGNNPEIKFNNDYSIKIKDDTILFNSDNNYIDKTFINNNLIVNNIIGKNNEIYSKEYYIGNGYDIKNLNDLFQIIDNKETYIKVNIMNDLHDDIIINNPLITLIINGNDNIINNIKIINIKNIELLNIKFTGNLNFNDCSKCRFDNNIFIEKTSLSFKDIMKICFNDTIINSKNFLINNCNLKIQNSFINNNHEKDNYYSFNKSKLNISNSNISANLNFIDTEIKLINNIYNIHEFIPIIVNNTKFYNIYLMSNIFIFSNNLDNNIYLNGSKYFLYKTSNKFYNYENNEIDNPINVLF